MASPQYMTVERLEETGRSEDIAALREAAKPLLEDRWSRTDVEILLWLQVDLERGKMILQALAGLPQEDHMKTTQQLIECAGHAAQDLYNSPVNTATKPSHRLWSQISAFGDSTLKIPPLPTEQTRQAAFWGGEAETRWNAMTRDCDEYSEESGGECPFTCLPFAQVAHILPARPEQPGDGPPQPGLWLWTWIVLPTEVYRAAWDGGLERDTSSNVLMMCDQLLQYYDRLRICFQPILSPSNLDFAFDLELEVPSRTGIDFYRLRDRDGNLIKDKARLRWEPRRKVTREDVPSPLLISLHRYLAHIRVFLKGLARLPEAHPESLRRPAEAGSLSSWQSTRNEALDQHARDPGQL